jgi:DNA-directed RNA polymerase specialized sigma24 family protein
LRIDIVRNEGRRILNRTYLPLPDENEDESSVDESVLKYFQTAPDQESTFDLQRLIDALQMLPPDERRAVELCHILGYDEESADRNKRTAATICGVTGRTIRNRLRRAAARLSSYKELIQ